MMIRPYAPTDEQQWLRCRAVSLLDTAYYDEVEREKPRYTNVSIELVAVQDDMIVGLLDVECDTEQRRVCSKRPGLGAMIWNVMVAPDYRRQGIGRALLEAAQSQLTSRGFSRLEAWTRDDPLVHAWYAAMGFVQKESYWHLFFTSSEIRGLLGTHNIDGLRLVAAYGEYVGNDPEVLDQLERVHRCSLYIKSLHPST